jgi:hypothetical protein
MQHQATTRKRGWWLFYFQLVAESFIAAALKVQVQQT